MTDKTSDSRPGRGWRDFVTPGNILLVVLAALTLIFIFQNTRDTTIRLLVPEVTMPLWTALLGTAVMGLLCGRLLARRR